MTTVIVGAGHAGFQGAATLRQRGYEGAITLVAGELGLPYQRPPLSKDLLHGETTAEAVAFRPAAFYEKKGIGLYEAAGARVGTLSQLVGPRVMLAGARLAAGGSGARQGQVIGHAAQLGGVLIVAPDGSVPYAHLAENAADLAPEEEVLEAAHKAGAAA